MCSHLHEQYSTSYTNLKHKIINHGCLAAAIYNIWKMFCVFNCFSLAVVGGVV